MKKRLKLFSTIASLCLAVALMAFGVWAATNVSFTVSNKVSFTATANVKAKVWHTTAVEKCTQSGATTDTSEGKPDLTFNGSEDAKGGESYEVEGGLALGDVTLTATNGSVEQMTYSYTITIKNTATSNDSFPYLKVEITFNNAHNYSAQDGYGVEISYGDDKTATEVLGAGETKIYTVKITIDNAKSVKEIDLGSSVILTAQADNTNK